MPVDTSPCLNWPWGKTKAGYGQIRGGLYAHRVSYCDANGLSIKDIAGLVVRHTCDNPSCVNPTHLLVGTQADNMRDKVERGRHLDSPETVTRKKTAQQKRRAEYAVSDETRRRQSAAHIGIKQSDETKRRKSAALKEFYSSPENHAKLSAMAMRRWHKDI